MFLRVHQSAVGQEDVFVSRHRPNMHGVIESNIAPNVASLRNESFDPIHVVCTNRTVDDDVKVSIMPLMNHVKNKFDSVQIRYDFSSGLAMSALQSGNPMKAVATNPVRLNLRILGKWQHEAKLPLPIDNAAGQTKVARKSPWIEHTVPVAELEALHSRPDSVFQLHRELGSWPCLEHLHCVNAHALCELRIHEHGANAEWLTIHTSSAATTFISEENDYTVLARSSIPGRLRIGETMSLIYRNISGLGGIDQIRSFWVIWNHDGIGMVHVDSIRFDVSNQTVFIDAAFIPMTAGCNEESNKTYLPQSTKA
jgi:hypothetical protein